MRYTLDEHAEIGKEIGDGDIYNNCNFYYGAIPKSNEHTVIGGKNDYYAEEYEQEENKGITLWDLGMIPFALVGIMAELTYKGISSLINANSTDTPTTSTNEYEIIDTEVIEDNRYITKSNSDIFGVSQEVLEMIKEKAEEQEKLIEEEGFTHFLKNPENQHLMKRRIA